MYFFKLSLKTAIVMSIILFGWIMTYQNTCFSLFFAFLFWLLIAWSFIDIKMHERLCIRQCYFHPKSLISKILSSRIMVTIFFLTVAFLMSYSALISILEFDTLQWGYIVIHILILTLLYMTMQKVFVNVIQEKYLKIMAREWSINIAAIFLLAWVIYWSLKGETPLYLQSTLKETLSTATTVIQSNCHVTDTVLRFNKETEAISWWLMSKESEVLKSEHLKLGAWIIFLFFQALAVLGLNRWIAQIIYLIDNYVLKQKKKDEKDV